jgi:hypothetical protein
MMMIHTVDGSLDSSVSVKLGCDRLKHYEKNETVASEIDMSEYRYRAFFKS